MDARTIETDVLVIGGGGAALMAALEARKKDADVRRGAVPPDGAFGTAEEVGKLVEMWLNGFDG
jgi:NADPH-dependent 2,4-dienoyl-CoA reductase/sulfur reductase-like enzyme